MLTVLQRLFSCVFCVLLLVSLFLPVRVSCESSVSLYTEEEEILPPSLPVPEEVKHVLDIASEEVGYREGDHGYSKYGVWAGDPYCQWCAEFLSWCVDQADQQWHSSLLGSLYPLYSGSNTGRSWFIDHGRYVIRKGPVENWGYMWLKGASSFLTSGDYIPQPGDYVFFTWTSDLDTDHVALVEYCSVRKSDGCVLVHVIEGNNPDSVQRGVYELNYNRILGYGTVHDMADITMKSGNHGEKVRQLQEKLSYLGYLSRDDVDGNFGPKTTDAVKAFQTDHLLRPTGIASIVMQNALNEACRIKEKNDPLLWTVIDEEEAEN